MATCRRLDRRGTWQASTKCRRLHVMLLLAPLPRPSTSKPTPQTRSTRGQRRRHHLHRLAPRPIPVARPLRRCTRLLPWCRGSPWFGGRYHLVSRCCSNCSRRISTRNRQPRGQTVCVLCACRMVQWWTLGHQRTNQATARQRGNPPTYAELRSIGSKAGCEPLWRWRRKE